MMPYDVIQSLLFAPHVYGFVVVILSGFMDSRHIFTHSFRCAFTCSDIRMDVLVPHYSDVIMGAIASQITSLTIVYSTVYPGADQRNHQSSASLASVWGIHRWPVNSPHKWPVTRKMFPFDDVIMEQGWHRPVPSHNIARIMCTILMGTAFEHMNHWFNQYGLSLIPTLINT